MEAKRQVYAKPSFPAPSPFIQASQELNTWNDDARDEKGTCVQGRHS
jgi:hypothetical protein